jgi:transposase
MNARQPYPSDLTDDQSDVIRSLIPAPRPGGRPAKYPRREIVNALLYVTRTGCQWRALPHDLPPWRIVYWCLGQLGIRSTMFRVTFCCRRS